MALDNQASPSVIQITIEQSKGDQFRKGVQIYLGRNSHAVCPVHGYLSRRGSIPGPLFLFSNGKWLTKDAFSTALNKALAATDGFLSVQCAWFQDGCSYIS